MHAEGFEYEDLKFRPKKYSTLKEIVEDYKNERQKFVELTNTLGFSSFENKDLTSFNFYDWFVEDFSEEWNQINDILDYIEMSNGNLYKLDRKMQKREEPQTSVVIDPLAPHA